ncbi:MAG: peptide deformylase [Gammaproteobacteria bacterium]|nr:peptide deformylase [Gammaproteobacteria bacterium]
MTILKILHYPDDRLRTVAQPVTEVNDEIRQIVADMFETMYQAPGIGLAATQVDIHQRIIVIDISEEKNQPLCLINPEITARDGEQEMDEGCLSVPGIYETVKRADQIDVKALDQDGNVQEIHADGLLAVCIQHEMDHLAGKLFVDYLSMLKRSRIKKKLVKQQKQDHPVAL